MPFDADEFALVTQSRVTQGPECHGHARNGLRQRESLAATGLALLLDGFPASVWPTATIGLPPMTTESVAVLIALGIGFVVWITWYVSSALQTAFDRTLITGAIRRDLTRRLLLISTSRLRGTSTARRYVVGSGFITFWPFLLALVTTGVARSIQLGSLVACLVISTYGFVLFRRLDSMRRDQTSGVDAERQPGPKPP
jgi:hypothetical protein